MNETWLPIVGYEGLFEVSDAGQVRSMDRVITFSNGRVQRYSGALSTLVTRPTGHLQVMIGANSKWRTRLVHQLVLEAFVGPRPAGAGTRHLNGIPNDNRLENLTWGTPSENTRDMVTHGVHNNARKTHCKNGHEFTPENIKPQSNGGRDCRQCKRDRWHATEKFQRPSRKKAAA